MKNLRAIAVAAAMAAVGSPALSGEPTAEEIEKVLSVLEDMQCEMDEDEIDKEADGYELDDVFCADGQYDMQLNAAFEVVSKTKE